MILVLFNHLIYLNYFFEKLKYRLRYVHFNGVSKFIHRLSRQCGSGLVFGLKFYSSRGALLRHNFKTIFCATTTAKPEVELEQQTVKLCTLLSQREVL